MGVGYTLGLLGLMLVQRLTLPDAIWRSGALALSRILAPYLFLPLLFGIPFALRRRPHVGWLRAALLLGGGGFVICFPPRFPAAIEMPPAAYAFTAMIWNVKTTNPQGDAFSRYIRAQSADIVALQECDWHGVATDESLAQQYPYQLVLPADGVPPGIALLSVYPILDYGVLGGPETLWDIPRVLWARLKVEEGRSLVVVTPHPRSPLKCRFESRLFCTEQRDAQLAAVAELTAQFIVQGEPVLVLGDLNLTEREVAYAGLTDRLVDAHTRAGRGWGLTWGTLGWVPLLRLDYVLSSEAISPLSLDVDCGAPDSDHCRVLSRLALAKGP